MARNTLPKLSVQIFSGSDTYGSPIEVALRSDGKAFWRTRQYNGYGVGYTKWLPYTDIVWVTEVTNVYDGTVSPVEPGQIMQWGFNKLTTSGLDQSRYVRLPK